MRTQEAVGQQCIEKSTAARHRNQHEATGANGSAFVSAFWEEPDYRPLCTVGKVSLVPPWTRRAKEGKESERVAERMERKEKTKSTRLRQGGSIWRQGGARRTKIASRWANGVKVGQRGTEMT